MSWSGGLRGGRLLTSQVGGLLAYGYSDVYHEIINRYPGVQDSVSTVSSGAGSGERQPLKVVIPGGGKSSQTVQKPPVAPPSVQQRSVSPGPAKPLPSKPVPSIPSLKELASLDNLMADLGGLMSETAFSSPEGPKRGNEPFVPKKSSSEAIRNGGAATNPSQAYQGSGSGELARLQQQVENLAARLREKDEEVVALLGDAQRRKLESEQQYRELQQEYEAVLNENSNLRADLESQEETSRRMKEEAANLLAEVKGLSVENASLRGAKETSTSQINELFIQIQDGKTKLQKEQARNRELQQENDRLHRELENASSRGAGGTKGFPARTSSPVPSDSSSKRGTLVPVNIK
ncbi:hypothetical protein HDU91_003218, partial [Kappamyces sp. JEL0680]